MELVTTVQVRVVDDLPRYGVGGKRSVARRCTDFQCLFTDVFTPNFSTSCALETTAGDAVSGAITRCLVCCLGRGEGGCTRRMFRLITATTNIFGRWNGNNQTFYSTAYVRMVGELPGTAWVVNVVWWVRYPVPSTFLLMSFFSILWIPGPVP